MTEPQVRETVREWARECDCPPWVVRCVHDEGAVCMAIVSLKEHLSKEQCPIEGACLLGQEYQLLRGIEAFEPCSRCGQVLKGTGIATALEGFDDYESALAAFHKAEQELLRADE